MIGERQLYRHRTQAGLRLGDGKTVDLLKYAAWLVTTRHAPQPDPPGDPYEEMKDRARARNAALSVAGRDIGELHAVGNPDCRALAERDFRAFCDGYFPQTFCLPWSDEHLRVLARIEEAVLKGGLFALAMPRGSSKSSIAECACLWAVLFGHRESVCLIGAGGMGRNDHSRVNCSSIARAVPDVHTGGTRWTDETRGGMLYHEQGLEVPRRIALENTPIRGVKPVVVPAQYFVWGPLIAGFVSFFPGFFTFVVSQMVGDPFEYSGRGFDPTYGLVAFALSFVVCMGLLWMKCFVEPERTTFGIFSDRVEYDEGLWNRHRRTVVFDQVIDVELTEGVLQQTRQAGTVTLVTQQLVSGRDGKLSNRRIALRNVPQPHEVYELVRSLALRKKDA